VRIAKAAFYKDRSYGNLFQRTTDRVAPPQELDALRAWLPGGKVDQKREDALALLRHLRETGAGAPKARFRFERTTMWEHLLTAATDDPAETMVLTELRLEGAAYLDARERAVSRVFHASKLDRRDLASNAHPVADPNTGSESAAERLQQHARDETRRARNRIVIEPLVDTIILERLRESGDYERLLTRAQAKRNCLAALDMFPPEIGDVDATPEDLTAWFCARSRQDPDIDPTAWADRLHFEDTLTFLRALAGEYLYARTE
jgi:hypothetical protein